MPLISDETAVCFPCVRRAPLARLFAKGGAA